MCYSVVSGTRALLKYAKHRSEDPAIIAALEHKLKQWEIEFKHFEKVSGFEHPKLLVFTQQEKYEPAFYNWGLIPQWAKDKETAEAIQHKTLNARIETIHEKAAYKNCIASQKCVVLVDCFLEYHHQGKKKILHKVFLNNNEPLFIAAIYDTWLDKNTKVARSTFSILTCKANSMMAQLHNNPKLAEPRMPCVLNAKEVDNYLENFTTNKEIKFVEQVQEKILFAEPFDNDPLQLELF